MTELNPNSPETKVPALPTPQSPQQLLQALKELIEVREGQRGNALDQNVTWRELVKSGIASIVYNGQPVSSVDPNFPIQPSTGVPNLAPPPQPVGLSASSAIQTVILGWNDPGNDNIALTEVWRSSTNVAPDVGGSVAALIGTTEAYLYADDVGASGVTRYYWVRFRSKADVPGPFSAVTTGNTGLVGGVDLSDLIVTASKLAADAVEEGKIKDAAVTTTKIANLAVGNAAIANGAITNAKIGNLAVDSAKIADAAIVEAKIADLAVTNAKIAAAAITDAKIATATITAASIANATITGAKIASATIETANITDAAITGAKIGSATITAANIQDATITGAKIGSATITGANIASATIGGANIASATITGANIANATITNANINDLNASKINAGTLDAARIAAGTITGTMIAANSITGGNIQAGSINGDRIIAGTIAASRLAAGTITSNEIAAGTIVGADIAAGTITAGNIAAGTITADRMVAGTITAASGIIANAAIGSAQIANTIQSDNFSSSAGWQINKSGGATFNEVMVRGTIEIPCPGGVVEVGRDVGPGSNHHGLSLSEANFDNIFLRRNDGVVFFRVGSGTNNYMSYDSATAALTIKGKLTADAIDAVNTLNIVGDAVTFPRKFEGGFNASGIGPSVDVECQVNRPVVVIAYYYYGGNAPWRALRLNGSPWVSFDAFQVQVDSIFTQTGSGKSGTTYSFTPVFSYAPITVVYAWDASYTGTVNVRMDAAPGTAYGVGLVISAKR